MGNAAQAGRRQVPGRPAMAAVGPALGLDPVGGRSPLALTCGHAIDHGVIHSARSGAAGPWSRATDCGPSATGHPGPSPRSPVSDSSDLVWERRLTGAYGRTRGKWSWPMHGTGCVGATRDGASVGPPCAAEVVCVMVQLP